MAADVLTASVDRRSRAGMATEPVRVPGHAPLAERLRALAGVVAERPFVVTDAGTYAQMRDWSARLAGGLAALGVGRGDHALTRRGPGPVPTARISGARRSRRRAGRSR